MGQFTDALAGPASGGYGPFGLCRAEALTLTQEVFDTLDINQEKQVLGIIVEMANRSGFNKSVLTEWLEKVA